MNCNGTISFGEPMFLINTPERITQKSGVLQIGMSRMNPFGSSMQPVQPGQYQAHRVSLKSIVHTPMADAKFVHMTMTVEKSFARLLVDTLIITDVGKHVFVCLATPHLAPLVRALGEFTLNMLTQEMDSPLFTSALPLSLKILVWMARVPQEHEPDRRHRKEASHLFKEHPTVSNLTLLHISHGG